jgi:hypothetical protein
MCPASSRDCEPAWLTEAEVFGYWLEAVKSSATGVIIDADEDAPPF